MKEEEFVYKFERFQDEYDNFLMWCLNNMDTITMLEWNTKKSIEFRRRGLDTFFD
jgi:hypothetical protein